jgi:hypothetical protein
MLRTAACARITTRSKPRSRFDGRPRKFPAPISNRLGGSIRIDSSYQQYAPWTVRGECRHARDAQHAKSFRTRFFGCFLARNVVRNAPRFGRGVLSALRLHQLLWSVRLHLCPARSFRLPALRAAGELLCAPGLLHLRRSPGADHGAISAGDGHTRTTVSLRPPNRVNRPPIDLRLCGCELCRKAEQHACTGDDRTWPDAADLGGARSRHYLGYTGRDTNVAGNGSP